MKSQIINLRKKLFKNLKAKADSYEQYFNKDIEKYRKDQDKYSKRSFTPSNLNELTKAVTQSDIIYLGDFHTFDQNIRNVLRIVKVLIEGKSECCLALEMVDAKFQIYIDAFLNNHITELEFLESIQYHDSWRFPWPHYKLLFELAKQHNFKIHGINTSGTLYERDEFAADYLSKLHDLHPNTQILVLYGEYHITPNKIPAKVRELLPELEHVIIHQNLDNVYWKIIEEDNQYKFIKFNKNEFCINAAPPWIKYESMIYWFENLCDDPEFDIHDYIIENGTKIFNEDTFDNFLHLSKEMIKTIDLKIEKSVLENFNLYDHTDLEFIEQKVDSLPLKTLTSYYEWLILNGQSFRLPVGNSFYCSSYSMNRIAYLAGNHIYHIFLQKNNIKELEILSNRNLEQKFILFTFENMFSYFFSKLMNPHRKCDMYADIKEKLKTSNIKKDEKLVLEMTLHLLDTNVLNSDLKGKNLKFIHQISQYIGHIFGEYLYDEVFNTDTYIDIENKFLNSKVNEATYSFIKKFLLKNRKYKTNRKKYF